MKREAVLYQKSKDGKKAFYIDTESADAISCYLDEDESHIKKFRYALSQLLDGRPPRDLYDKEKVDNKTNNVYALKLFKGKEKNPRIYCQQFTDGCTKVFVIVASELLEKKKSQKNTKQIIETIRRISKYQYILIDETK